MEKLRENSLQLERLQPSATIFHTSLSAPLKLEVLCTPQNKLPACLQENHGCQKIPITKFQIAKENSVQFPDWNVARYWLNQILATVLIVIHHGSPEMNQEAPRNENTLDMKEFVAKHEAHMWS